MERRHSSRSFTSTPCQMKEIMSIVLVTLVLQYSSSMVNAWGIEGHRVICSVAEQLLNPIALASVEELLPDPVDGNLSDLCSWADDVRLTKEYGWSAPLHYIDTPDRLCAYDPIRDCLNNAGTPNGCASGAIRNYTNQLTVGGVEYNLTEALLFLSHIVGDIHQPLHVGFQGDSGGSSVEVYWFNARTDLHHVWDTDLIVEDIDNFYDGDIGAFAKSIHTNITGVWSREAAQWGTCEGGETACPDVYATESVYLACQWAYKDAEAGVSLDEDYFLSRMPIIHMRIAQAGTRLASIINKVYPDDELEL